MLSISFLAPRGTSFPLIDSNHMFGPALVLPHQTFFIDMTCHVQTLQQVHFTVGGPHLYIEHRLLSFFCPLF